MVQISTGTPNLLRKVHCWFLIRWHADIKPDNILLVNGMFKLADPGFAKFVKETGKNPEEVVFGGTWTYGGCDLNVQSFEGGPNVI